jgi:hypothetical protein
MQFVGAAIAEMATAGVAVKILGDEYASIKGARVEGYFDGDAPEFAVARGRDEPRLWLSVFLHEYCHFVQWRHDTPAWAAKLSGDVCPQSIFDAWLNGAVEMRRDQLESAVGLVLGFERECETIAIGMLEGMKRPIIDPVWYTMAANVYLGFYGVIMKTRRWYDKSPYSRPDAGVFDYVPGHRLWTIEECMDPPADFVEAMISASYEASAA